MSRKMDLCGFDEGAVSCRMLREETAFVVQRRLQQAGVTSMVLPIRGTD